MEGYKKTDFGQVVIDQKVLMTYASEVAYTTVGIVGMAAKDAKDGIVKLVKKDAVSKGISLTIENNMVTIDYHLIVKLGVNILSVQENLVDSIKYKIDNYTGLKLKKVNIYVDAVRTGKQSKGGAV